MYGNRGCLHDADGRIRRSHAGRRWIACRLEFRDRRRHTLLQPGRYTELFFLDEATAFAAGHRPCAECRREDYVRFLSIWSELHPGNCSGADAVDVVLHAERLDTASHTHRLHAAPYDALPDGAFVLLDGVPHLVLGNGLRRWTPAGYAPAQPRPGRADAVLITPPSLVAVLCTGWTSALPLFHPTCSGAKVRASSDLEP